MLTVSPACCETAGSTRQDVTPPQGRRLSQRVEVDRSTAETEESNQQVGESQPLPYLFSVFLNPRDRDQDPHGRAVVIFSQRVKWNLERSQSNLKGREALAAV